MFTVEIHYAGGVFPIMNGSDLIFKTKTSAIKAAERVGHRVTTPVNSHASILIKDVTGRPVWSMAV